MISVNSSVVTLFQDMDTLGDLNTSVNNLSGAFYNLSGQFYNMTWLTGTYNSLSQSFWYDHNTLTDSVNKITSVSTVVWDCWEAISSGGDISMCLQSVSSNYWLTNASLDLVTSCLQKLSSLVLEF